MAKFEYALVSVDRGDEPEFIEKLNELAAEGWRLVPIVIPETTEFTPILIVEREEEGGPPSRGVVRNL